MAPRKQLFHQLRSLATEQRNPRSAAIDTLDVAGILRVINDEDKRVAAAKKVDTLSRAKVRAQFERRFTSRSMAENYLSVYERLGARSAPQLRAVGD
mgnify:CR=1 FL=1